MNDIGAKFSAISFPSPTTTEVGDPRDATDGYGAIRRTFGSLCWQQLTVNLDLVPNATSKLVFITGPFGRTVGCSGECTKHARKIAEFSS